MTKPAAFREARVSLCYGATADLVRVSAILGCLPSHFLASAFACQSLLDSLLLPGLEVEGVFLSLFQDVFLHNLALKTPQSVFNRFTRVNLNISPSDSFALACCLFVALHRIIAVPALFNGIN